MIGKNIINQMCFHYANHDRHHEETGQIGSKISLCCSFLDKPRFLTSVI